MKKWIKWKYLFGTSRKKLTFISFNSSSLSFFLALLREKFVRYFKLNTMTKESNLSGSDQIFGKNTEFHRFGLISAILLVVGCLGGIAVGLGAIDHIVALTLVVVPTMVTLSLILAVSPVKQIITVGVIATIIDVILITFYALT